LVACFDLWVSIESLSFSGYCVFSQGWYNPDINEHGYSSSMEVPRAEEPWVLFQSSQNLMRARSCWLQKLEQNQ
jgi:hypothetical protein